MLRSIERVQESGHVLLEIFIFPLRLCQGPVFVEKAPTGLGSAAALQRLGTLCDTAGETREMANISRSEVIAVL